MVEKLEEFTVLEKAWLVAILTDPRNDTESQAYRKYLDNPPKAASHLRSLLESHGMGLHAQQVYNWIFTVDL